MIKLNGRSIQIPKIDIVTIAKLQKMGVSFDPETPLAFICGMIAVGGKMTYEKAATALQRHLDSEGNLDDIIEEVNQSLEDPAALEQIKTLYGSK